MNYFFEQISSQLITKKKENKPFYIQVKILPDSNENEIIEQLEDGTYKIRIKSSAIQGKANIELCKFLKKTFKLREVVIVSGSRERIKLIKLSPSILNFKF